MGRNFDGTNDSISFGSDASIDDLNPKTISYWMKANAAANDYVIGKANFAQWACANRSTGVVRFQH